MFNFLFNFLYYVLTFAVSVFFLTLGIVGIIFPWSTTLRSELITFILENSIAISLFGFAFLVIALTLLINMYLGAKRHYYYLRVGPRSVVIDESIIQQYLQTYWKQLFPNEDISTRLVMKKNKIKVLAELPYMPVTEQRLLIETIKEDLQDLFTRVLGYSQEFTLALSFQGKPK